MNLNFLNRVFDFAEERKEWIREAKALSQQISENLAMIIYAKSDPKFKEFVNGWKRELKTHCLNLAVEKIKAGENPKMRLKVLTEAFSKKEIEERWWLESLSDLSKLKEEGIVLDVNDEFYGYYKRTLDSLKSLIANRDLKGLDNYIMNYV